MTPAALRELEKRLKSEPDNLGLRVTVATALHEAGRHAEAVELYRSVAVAYRDQGRNQQAIAVCRSILEIAPDDPGSLSLLSALAPATRSSPARSGVGPELAPRRSSYDETPLPGPLPYHVADPTTRSHKKLSELEIKPRASEVELPEPDGSFTVPEIKAIVPEGTDRLAPPKRPSGSGVNTRPSAKAVVQDVAGELETRRRPRISSADLQKIALPLPDFEEDDSPTRPPADNDTEEEVTVPRDEFGKPLK